MNYVELAIQREREEIITALDKKKSSVSQSLDICTGIEMAIRLISERNKPKGIKHAIIGDSEIDKLNELVDAVNELRGK